MEISLTVPALLFPAIAILMLGYINRYIGTAGVIRNFKKDYDSGYKHTDIAAQLRILRKRIELSRGMITFAATALLFACLSMFLIFEGTQAGGKVSFGAALVAMILSICVSLYETFLSNKSLNLEIDNILLKEKSKK